MAQNSGFFNALLTNGVYDRQYNADHYTNSLAVIISDGVLRSTADDLAPTANGMGVNIGVGRAWIRGRWYHNDTVYNLVVPTAPTTYDRIDRVVLRLNSGIASRNIALAYIQGEPSQVPVPPTPLDTDDVKDLVLCDVYVAANATSVTVEDKRGDASVCGWVYSTSGDGEFFTSLDSNFYTWLDEKKQTLSSVTLFKQYVWRGTTTTSDQRVVVFNIPQYDPTGVDIIQVYFNGMLEVEGVDYTLAETSITFTNARTAGQEVVVVCYKSINGEGLGTVSDEVTELQNKVAALADFTEYNYICKGAGDNIALSQIAQDFLNGGDDGKRMTIRVYGTIGATSPYSGDGTTALPYRWFQFGQSERTSRKITFDFGCCSKIDIATTAGTQNHIFWGRDLHIVDANVKATASGANSLVLGFFSGGGRVQVDNTTMELEGYTGAWIGYTGTYNNCHFSVTLTAGAPAAFRPNNNSLLRLNGGEVYAYAPSGQTSIGVLVLADQSTTCVIVNGTAFPTVAKTGMTQTHAISDLSANGKCAYNNVITTLTVSATGQVVNGTLAISKPNMV